MAGYRAPVPLLRDGKRRFVLYIDRTTLEVFASDGLTYVPLAVIPKTGERRIQVSVTSNPVRFNKLEAFKLSSIWR